MEYNKNYHLTLHENLYNSSRYHRMRSVISYYDYFHSSNEFFRDKKILEFGCGLGQNIFVLSQFGFDVTGYDVSKFAVDFCNKLGIKATTKFNSLKKFDVVFSKFVLEHVTNPYEELKKIRSKLNDNGLLILVLAREKYRRVPLTPDVNRHLWTWNFQAINNLLYETGYRVVKNEMRYDRGGFKKLMFIYNFIDSELLYSIATKIVGIVTDSKEIRIYARKR